MYSITWKDFYKKLEEHTDTYVRVNDDDEEEEYVQSCPNGIIVERGKPTIVWATYNNQTYKWILQE